MLSQSNIDYYAQASQIDSYVAERDVVLTYVLKILDDGGLLDNLAFKGGTCLKKIYYGKTTRFSEDLDFTSSGIDVDSLKRKLKALLHDKEHYGIHFKINDQHSSKAGVVLSHGAVIGYSHAWNSDQFEFEVSYREKPSLQVKDLPLQDELYFRFLEFGKFKVPSLHRDELMAEKIRAAFQRLRPRDIYDLYRYSNSSYKKELVKTLAVIKCRNAKDSFNPQFLLKRIKDGKHNWSDLQRLVRPNQLPNIQRLVSETINHYSYLTNIDTQLMRIVLDSKRHKLATEISKILQNLK